MPRVLVGIISILIFVPTALANSYSTSESLSSFHQLNQLEGSLQDQTGVFKADYFGRGLNGFARGVFNIGANKNDRLVYAASFYLPDGFIHAAQGQVALMRFDNWDMYQDQADQGGLVIYSDKRARIIRGKYSGEQQAVTRPFNLPQRKWFDVKVIQYLSKRRALTKVFIDGEKINESTRPNFYGRKITRIRYGIVATSSGIQTDPLSLYFNKSQVSY